MILDQELFASFMAVLGLVVKGICTTMKKHHAVFHKVY